MSLIDFVQKVLTSDIAVRAYKTFVQIAGAQLALSGPVYPNTSTVEKAALAGAAAAIAVLWNALLTWSAANKAKKLVALQATIDAAVAASQNQTSPGTSAPVGS